MAKLKAYAKGTTESVEWTLSPELDPAEVGGTLSRAGRSDLVTLSTTTGWIFVEPGAFAAIEIIND